MKKRLGLTALLFALAASLASAAQLTSAEVTDSVDSGIPRVHDGGYMEISNEDWVDYFVEIYPAHNTVTFYYPENARRRNGFILPSGSKVSIPSQRQIWNLYGNNGRTITVGVHKHRTTPIRLVPDGREDMSMIGMRAIVHDGGKDNGELLMAWERRPQEYWPREPEPYYEPYDPYEQYDESYYYYEYDDGYPGQVIGREPPPQQRPPHRSPPPPPPHRNPPRRDPPPQHYGPPIQMPPKREHSGPPIQKPPHNVIDRIRR